MTIRFWLPILLSLGVFALGLLVLLLIIAPIAGLAVASEDRSQNIESATAATVLIKTHLNHGFLEDDDAHGRWEGTGFLINKERGWIVTNAHVAGYGPANLRVRFETDDAFSEAKRLFVDSKHDVAVIQIAPEAMPEGVSTLELDCDYELSRGESVFSIGHPQDQYFTSSLGVLSGEKDFHVDGSFFTTDLVTESGSSGGPVVAERTNKVVGMTTSGFTSSDLGFLTKSSDICRITELLEINKNPARPRFDFQTMIIDRKISSIVGAVFDSALNLEIGDEILSWNGTVWDPKTDGDLADVMRGYAQDNVNLMIRRGGNELSVNVPIRQGGSYHEREWIFFTGLLITEDQKADAAFGMGNTSQPVLIIESIDSNFDDTTDIEFGSGSEILRVDEFAGLDLQALYEYLSLRPDGATVSIVGRVYEWTPESYSTMMRYSFTIEDLDCSWCGETERSSGNAFH